MTNNFFCQSIKNQPILIEISCKDNNRILRVSNSILFPPFSLSTKLRSSKPINDYIYVCYRNYKQFNCFSPANSMNKREPITHWKSTTVSFHIRIVVSCAFSKIIVCSTVISLILKILIFFKLLQQIIITFFFF